MEKLLNYKFNDISLLNTAITHSSYAHEVLCENNEKLEFLGDAVLQLVISTFIFNEFKELSEGELSKLRANIVCEGTLAKMSEKIKISENIRIGKGEENSGGRKRPSILADAYEAIIGAIYVDGGFYKTEKYILSQMKDVIFELKNTFVISDYKTYLQELIQKNSTNPIEYVVVEESGPAHDKEFIVEVRHEGKVLGQGEGKSKKEAEQNAAKKAVEK